MQPTLDQGRQLLNLAGEAGVSLEKLQILYGTGLLSDLLKTENPAAVNREEFRVLLGFVPSVFRVKLGGPEKTDQIVSGLGFPANSYITQKNFPLKPHAIEEAEIEIYDPGCSFSEEEGHGFLKAVGLERPTHEHFLRFAEQCGTATTSKKKPFVIFLHEPWLGPYDNRRVLYLDRSSAHRKLHLLCPDYRFLGACVLAGVRPRKPA